MEPADDPYLAWCLDEAAFMWGVNVENSMVEAANAQKDDKQKDGARQHALQSMLTDPGENDDDKVSAGTYRDPAAMMGGSRAMRK